MARDQLCGAKHHGTRGAHAATIAWIALARRAWLAARVRDGVFTMIAAPTALEVSRRIAARLVRSAQWEGDRCTWRVRTAGSKGSNGRPVAVESVSNGMLYQ